MIVEPINDRPCLGSVTEFVRRMMNERHEQLASLAAQFSTTHQLARWIRLKPQVDDEGNPNEGPKVYACRPPQRLRVFWETPNCFERTVEYVLLAEFIDPSPTRSMATVKTRFGKHTLPVEDNLAVVLDPVMTRNELEGALFQLDRRPLYVARNEALDWMAAIAGEPAAARGELHRVRNARGAMRAVMAGERITAQSVADIAYTVDEADREASNWFGARGLELHRRTAEELTNALITQRRRNAGMELQLDNLIQLGAAVLQHELTQSTKSSAPPSSSGTSSGSSSSGQTQLGKVGVGNPLLMELEKLIGKDGIKKGITLGGIAIGGPVGGAIGSLAGDALISTAFRNASGHRNASSHRNASFWAVKTPGVILDEINTTDNAVRSLGKDIWATFRETFATQQRLAEARFEREKGRKPYVGAQGDPTADLAQVYLWMQPVPSQVDIEAKSYQGAFVDQWGEFTREWGEFFASHKSWYDRMWRGAYDKAVEFRERVLGWRRRFEQLGGTPTAPEPVMPSDRGQPLAESGPWKSILLVAGIGAAALILPEVLRTFRGRRPEA
jgi:hypothetical protein